MTKTVLLFPSLSEIGEEVIRALDLNKEFKLVKCSTTSIGAQCVYLPNIHDENFKRELLEIIKMYSIDIIYPAHDLFIDWISDNREDIPAKVVLDNSNIINLVRSKSATYKFFNGLLNVPKVYSKTMIQKASMHFPLFVKPDRGFGSIQSRIIDNEIDFFKYIDDNNFVITDYLPGKEYTVDCISDSCGNLLISEVREREEIRNGVCKSTLVIDNCTNITDMAMIISAKLKIKGAWFFQVKENKNKKPYLLEIAPRISGNTALLRANGVNSTLLSLYILTEGKNVSIAQSSSFVSMRRPLEIRLYPLIQIDTIYIDLDDTIIINNMLVPESIAILVKAQNLGIKIILITRHSGDLSQTLSSYNISHFFDEVHQLTDIATPKSIYMNSKSSIFVDDSHNERFEVHSNVGIPVFSTDMLYLLSTCLSSL